MLAPMDGIAATMMSPPDPVAEPAPPLLGMPEPFAESFAPTEPMAMPEPAVPLDPDQPIAGPSRPLMRRRSSLRQNGGRSSANGTPKMVAWAMDRDWADHLTKFDHIVYAAEFAGSHLFPLTFTFVCCWILTPSSGDELEDARKMFQEEISGVHNLRLAITSALERLRLETDTLQVEEANLRAHEERVVASFERLKEKEANYKERGKRNQPFLLYSIPPTVFLFLIQQFKLSSMRASGLSSPPIIDARAQRSAELRRSCSNPGCCGRNVKPIYEPDLIHYHLSWSRLHQMLQLRRSLFDSHVSYTQQIGRYAMFGIQVIPEESGLYVYVHRCSCIDVIKY
jgi:hypothetical protein